jgi:hypothetical protein
MRFPFIAKAMIDGRPIAPWMWALIDEDRRLQSGICRDHASSIERMVTLTRLLTAISVV